MKRAFLLVALVSCAAPPPLPQRPQQHHALAVVWESTLGATTAAPPIEWREDVCVGSTKRLAAVVYEGRCYSGMYLPDDRALIAWRGSFSRSAFAHELIHAWQWSRGVQDPGHALKPDWDLEGAANEALRADDL